MPSNAEFLTALFGDDAQWSHVTDFTHDPGNIPEGIEHLKAWKGDYFSRYRFQEQSNQYFTISTFFADGEGRARRRKALFRATHVIVLDDVREKLSVEAAQRLPTPSYILETSPGSEQWGYILAQPCTDRARVENLLDGLVANGLAPDGKDPGMKGVTRYVRLPGGVNNKASKLVDGMPFQCRLLTWNPFNVATMEELAAPFAVNLDAPRREGRLDGAAAVDDHPILQVHDVVHIKDVRSEGRFDITCPWVDEHTGQDDSGAAIFTNADGTIGFKCHHGACQTRTGRHLLQVIERDHPGFTTELSAWQLRRSFAQAAGIPSPSATPSPAPAAPASVAPPPPSMPPAQPQDTLAAVFCTLRNEPPYSPEARVIAGRLLHAIESLPAMEKTHWQNEVREHMRWTKTEFRDILQGLRGEWYSKSTMPVDFYSETVYVREQNAFLDRKKRIWYTPEAYQNSFCDIDPDARKNALSGMVNKVDKVDYAPLMPAVFVENGITYGNSWSDESEVKGAPGDVSWYLDHFEHLGWVEHRKHILQWMAFTIRHPDQKINHALLLGSGEGCGKDFLLHPLAKALGDNTATIEGDDLLSDFNEHLMSAKYLHVNETELGDRTEAMAISAKLKPLAAAPPMKLRVNQKHVSAVQVRNIVSVAMTTNSQLPLRLTGDSRRFFALWSDMNPRGRDGNMKPEWVQYWKERWHWMHSGGAEAVIHYLRTAVSLHDFHPGVAPIVTDYLRDIRDASKSPLQLSIESLIRRRIGIFGSDLITTSDVMLYAAFPPNDPQDVLQTDSRTQITPARIDVTIKAIAGCAHIRAGEEGETRLWALRDAERYRAIPPDELEQEYRHQISQVRGATSSPGLRVVK